MCRIAGIINRDANNLEQDVISMRDAMDHGGPDGAGVYIDAEDNIGLGHRRLSLIDLSEAGVQPMKNHDGDLIIVFNGEIYNYLELKQELAITGYKFKSATDTEVILAAYQRWGAACFAKLKGMFAIALYDKRVNKLILARDHAGIKPLYYYCNGAQLYFASEVRAFHALPGKWEENSDWKVYFLTYGYLPEPVTTIKGVQPLAKGSYAEFEVSTLALKITNYTVEDYKNDITDEVTARKQVHELLAKAVKRHLISDAPIGVFLSGGIDSSILTLLAKSFKDDLHTLSIDFKDSTHSEQRYQQIIVDKCKSNHRAFLLTEALFREYFSDIMDAMDQPSADGINSYFICKYAKESGLKAVLSGIGADEMFGGYPSFKMAKYVRNSASVPAMLFNIAGISPKDKYKKIAFLERKDAIGEYLFYRGYFIPSETAMLLDMDVKQVKAILSSITMPAFVSKLEQGNRVSYLESNLYMKDQLLKDVDSMSMWHSLEVRVPFLDNDLIKAVQHISCAVKFGKKQSKALLIDSFKDMLPQEIWDRKKQGFTFPFNQWMKKSDFLASEGLGRNKLNGKFLAGQLEWSRYWTYCIAENKLGITA